MDTLTKSCSPTIVITANGEVQTHEEATVYVKELDIFLTMKVLKDTPAVYRSESCAMNTDTLTSGPTVKNHISLKTVFKYNATRRTSFLSWFQACLSSSSSSSHPSTSMTPSKTGDCIVLHLPQARLRHQKVTSSGTVRLENERIEVKVTSPPATVSTSKVDDRWGQPVVNQANKIPKTT